MLVLALILSSKSGIWFPFTKEGFHSVGLSQYIFWRKDGEEKISAGLQIRRQMLPKNYSMWGKKKPVYNVDSNFYLPTDTVSHIIYKVEKWTHLILKVCSCH